MYSHHENIANIWCSLPQNYMFAEMRAALGIPKSVDILEHIYSLPTPEAQTTAMEKIRSIERRAMEHQKPQPGLVELMAYLSSKNIRKGICTRNFDTPVHNLLTKFLAGHEFAPIVTRDFRPPKPDPAGILHIARSWGLVRRSTGEAGVPADETREKERVKRGDVEKTNGDGLLAKTEEGEEVADASQLIMVGDSIDDMVRSFALLRVVFEEEMGEMMTNKNRPPAAEQAPKRCCSSTMSTGTSSTMSTPTWR